MTSFGQSTKRRVEQPKRSRQKQNSTPRPRVPPSRRFYGIFSEAPSRRPSPPPWKTQQKRTGALLPRWLAGFLRCWRILANSTIFVFNLSQLFFFYCVRCGLGCVLDRQGALSIRLRARLRGPRHVGIVKLETRETNKRTIMASAPPTQFVCVPGDIDSPEMKGRFQASRAFLFFYRLR